MCDVTRALTRSSVQCCVNVGHSLETFRRWKKGNPGDIVNMTGEGENTVENNTKALDPCGDRYGGVSNGD